MAIAALIVAIGAALIALASAVHARALAFAAKGALAIEQDRRRDETGPRFDAAVTGARRRKVPSRDSPGIAAVVAALAVAGPANRVCLDARKGLGELGDHRPQKIRAGPCELLFQSAGYVDTGSCGHRVTPSHRDLWSDSTRITRRPTFTSVFQGQP
ncbi:MAG: hypothetical protein M3Y33_14670 [Actinomycetota bacterium]|nr:hypothetical protein [Actinomycetota bacterium]